LPVSPVSYVEAQEGDDGQRLDNFLLRTLGAVPRSLVYRILRTSVVDVLAAPTAEEAIRVLRTGLQEWLDLSKFSDRWNLSPTGS
jgi:hypothetical protein